MKASTIIQFISKYNLPSAEVEMAKWKMDNVGLLSVRFTSLDESCFGYVATPATGFPEGEFFIANTGTLRGLLGVLGEDIKISTKANTAGITNVLLMDDGKTKVQYGLGDVRNAKKNRVANAPIDDTNVIARLKLTPEFVQTFLKSKGALKDVETFTVWSDGTHAEIIIGYEQRSNGNRVILRTEPEKLTAFKHINFRNKYLYDILYVNRQTDTDDKKQKVLASDGILEVIQMAGEPPFIRVSFVGTDYTSVYIIAMNS